MSLLINFKNKISLSFLCLSKKKCFYCHGKMPCTKFQCVYLKDINKNLNARKFNLFRELKSDKGE